MASPEAAEAVDWRSWAAFALGVLKWPPSEFWAATPGDIRLAIAGLHRVMRPQGEPLARAELDALRRRFPDQSN
jgi:uncharacterized phage protein (TIGR02216 family)